MLTNPNLSRAAFLQQCYSHYLGRVADLEGLSAWHSSKYTREEIEAAFESSVERQKLLEIRETIAAQIAPYAAKKRMLIFGAFGNGNVGDAIQPSIIANDLEHRFDVALFSYSELKTLDYQFPPSRKLSIKSDHGPDMLNPILLSLFDGLIIGGGGLLAHPHVPIWDPNWAHLLSTPYVIWACGVSNPLPPQVENLIRLAAAVSGRDAQSCDALTKIRTDALECPDPVLSLLDMPFVPGGTGRAFILRGPLREVHLSIRNAKQPMDTVIAMEPAVDWPLLEVFPDLHFATSVEALTLHLKSKCEVVTERYHGAIVALHMGKITYGLTRGDHNESKIAELFRALAAEAYCGREWLPISAQFPLETLKRFLADRRGLYQEATTLLANALIQLPQPKSSTPI